jgi:hypothetical protein
MGYGGAKIGADEVESKLVDTSVEGMDVEAWLRRASRACLIGNTIRERMLCTKKTRNGATGLCRMTGNLMN